MNRLPLLIVAVLAAACGGTGGTADSAGTFDAVAANDSRVAGFDAARDDAAEGADLPAVPDLAHFELPPPVGTGELGDECLQDGDCVSGLCYATAGASGCTVECSNQGGCQAMGLICAPLRPGLSGCIPAPAVQANCTDHGDCPWPTACVAQFGWCDLPECTLDSDCPGGEACEPGTRRCQPATCASTYECASPVEYCLGGVCGPPECTQRADCEAGEICSYAQGICTDATPCNEEGACNLYNQVCVDGLCEPNLCATPCANEASGCNPATGKCGPLCQAADDCPTGWGCDVAAGICYENVPPVAVAVVGGQGESVVQVPLGTTVTLDGTGSFDPDGGTLTYRWTLLEASPYATGPEAGAVVCDQPTCPVGPLTWGLSRVGLHVQDPAGAWSIQAAVTLVAQ